MTDAKLRMPKTTIISKPFSTHKNHQKSPKCKKTSGKVLKGRNIKKRVKKEDLKKKTVSQVE